MTRIVRATLVACLASLPIAIGTVADAQVYPPSACVIGVSAVNVTEGSSLTVTGSGFPPGPVAVFFDETRQVGTAVANGSGNFTFVFTVPGGVGVGSHIIRAIPADPLCDPIVRINVVAGTPGVRQEGKGAFAYTGSDATTLLFLALLALVVGTLLVLSARRRRSVRQSVGT
jgi:hypothetical protein